MTIEEIKKELETEIQLSEYVGSEYANCVKVDVLKGALLALSEKEEKNGARMTREKAKEIFEDNFTVINTHGHYTKEEEGQAQDLAISALSENKGKWLATENEEMEIDGYFCSKCDLPMPTDEKTPFCPFCGADMRGDKAE